MAGAADGAAGRERGPKGGCVSDEKVIVREGGQLPPCPLPGGESGIRWSRSRPATLEEITRALDRIEGRNGRIAPPVDELEQLLRDAFTALDIDSTQESEEVARRAYPLFRDAASVERRLAMIDESWSRGFATAGGQTLCSLPPCSKTSRPWSPPALRDMRHSS